MCYLQILKPQAAVADLKKVISLEPNNENVKSQLVSTQKLIRRIEFEKVGRQIVCSVFILNEDSQGNWNGRGEESPRSMPGNNSWGYVVNEYTNDRWWWQRRALGGCEVEKTYTGPKLSFEDGKYLITLQFIKDMIEWFKDGKTLPKRYVWEIVIGAYERFMKEESLVNVDIPDNVTIDIIGDVHGNWFPL